MTLLLLDFNFHPQLLAALVGATAMATWHAALFMEMEKVHEPGFPLTWPNWLQVERVTSSPTPAALFTNSYIWRTGFS